MSKTNLICLKCGTVQVRTDINEQVTNNYTLIKSRVRCPKCEVVTTQAITKNLDSLRKKLKLNNTSSLDNYILKLVRR